MFDAEFCEKRCPICTRARQGHPIARLLQRIETLVTFGGCPWGRARQRKYGVPPGEPLPPEGNDATSHAPARGCGAVLDLRMRQTPHGLRIAIRLGLGLSLLVAVVRITTLPWSWRVVPDSIIWILFAAVFIPSLVLMWRERRWVFPPHCCRQCGYNLTGNTSGTCPECGASIRTVT